MFENYEKQTNKYGIGPWNENEFSAQNVVEN